ncbi:MAG: hypothetical protein ACOYK9_05675 [Chlamydiia bacterium]
MDEYQKTLKTVLDGLQEILDSERYEMYAVMGLQMLLINESIDLLTLHPGSKEIRQMILNAFEKMEPVRNQILKKMDQNSDSILLPPNFTEAGFREFFRIYETTLRNLNRLLHQKPKKKTMKLRI